MATKIQPEQIAQGGALDGYTLVWNTSLDMWIPDTIVGAGYSTIQEEGTPLTPRNVLNFVGSGFTAADDSTRTNVSLDTFLNTLATSGSVSLTAHVSGLLPFANIADLGALSVLGRASNSSGVMAAINAGTDNQVLRRSGTSIGFGSINLASSDAVTGDLPFSNIAQIATDRLLGRDTAGTGDIESLTVGGGIEFTGTGGIQTSAFTGDATKTAGGTALTLATVNSNVGSFGSATQVATFTVNGKGLITAASNTAISIPSTQVSDFTEAVQDILGAISVDSNTLDWTYNDPSNTLTANVKTQMSLTSDASGIKLTNDASSPGTSQYYGTNGSGVKGWYSITSGVTDHGALTGLSDDDHTIYALLAGRSAGQTLIGGTGAAESLILNSTSNATKGIVFINNAGGNVRIGGGTSASALQLLEPSGSGSNYTEFIARAQSGNITYQLPASQTQGYLRNIDGSGDLGWALVDISSTAHTTGNLPVSRLSSATLGSTLYFQSAATSTIEFRYADGTPGIWVEDNVTPNAYLGSKDGNYAVTASNNGVDIATTTKGFSFVAGTMRFKDADASHYAAIQAPTTISSNYTLTLPVDDGASGQYLKTDGSGVLSWDTPAGGGSSDGSSGAIQFSDGSGGFLSDEDNLFWNNGANTLELSGTTSSIYAVSITGQGHGVSVAPSGTISGALTAVNASADATGLVNYLITNTNTSTGGARLQLSVSSSSTGDPYIGMLVGDQNYVLGIDNDNGNKFILGQGTSPSGVTVPNFVFDGSSTGVGGVTSPTSKLHLPAGTATGNTAPLKFTSGTALTTPEDGAMEYHGSHLYFTIGSTRYQLDQQGGGSTSWADLVSGTQTGSLTATLATNETFAMSYDGGNFAYYADDATSTFKAFSKDQTQYIELNDADVRIGSGTSRMQYIDGALRLYDSDSTNYVQIQTAATGALTSNLTLTLPSNNGLSNNVLRTDGAGGLSWVDITSLGVGNVIGPGFSSNNQIVLFSGTGGTTLTGATGSGIVTSTSGVYGTLTAPTGDLVGTTESQTLTNKRIDPRVTSTASTTAPAPNIDTTDIYIITALAGNCTFGVPTGSPVQGQKLIYRIKDDGTARTLSYNAVYRAMGVVRPTTTVISKTLYLGCIYNATDSKWDIVAVNLEA
jgi:hypothetical protein